MQVFLNGEFVPEAQAVVPVSDRSFLYGDGLFETLRLAGGQPFQWEAHWERLARGASGLGLVCPLDSAEARTAALELARRNGLTDAVLRLTLSRGSGPRGYSLRAAHRPCFVMTVHPAAPVVGGVPLHWNVVTATLRLPAGNSLAAFKTNNKLVQVLARAEAEARGADEALLLNTEGFVTETAAGNFFWMERGRVFTPPLAAGGLPGVARALVMELAAAGGHRVEEKLLPGHEGRRCESAFITMSTQGVVEVSSLDGTALSSSELVAETHRAYWRRVAAETGGS
jgi:aminodeoxychorismate lyase